MGRCCMGHTKRLVDETQLNDKMSIGAGDRIGHHQPRDVGSLLVGGEEQEQAEAEESR
jgi:hypothetical protein